MYLRDRCTKLPGRGLAILLSLAFLAAGAATLSAQDVPERPADLAAKSFRHVGLLAEDIFVAPADLPAKAAGESLARLEALGVAKKSARLDARSGRFATLLSAVPLIPGDGVGNDLAWDDLGLGAAKSGTARSQAAWQALLGYLDANVDTLEVDPDELTTAPVLTSYDDGDLIQIYAPRLIDGIEVRGNYVSAVVKMGNLILFGAHKWSDRGAPSSRPWISADEARTAAEGFLAPFTVAREWGKPERLYLPLVDGNAPGYRYQAAWAVKVNVEGDDGSWEVLVDAHSGEILANEDRNAYAEVKGGVLPVTNDGIVPDGVEQPGWPMPYQDTTLGTTDTGGNVAGGGSFTATFFGPYVNINDNCGAESLTATDTLDWGTSGGTDCVTPGFGGAGNTHASRTGFYELNKIIEMARGQLPANAWLQQRLTSNMNINQTCNAFWNGTVNFYRSGGGCSNTGEIAGVFDHEWGHGLDANDATPGIASPSGEGIADIYTALRLNDSCIGRNFRSTPCTGNGDPCLTCTGVRDIDYLKRQSGQPHDYTWSNANCAGSVHCVGGVYSEAVWSLWKRKLQSPPYSYDNNTAHEITTRLTFLGAGATGTWFSGGPPQGGCGASSGYMNYLAADDDNGNLNDGTPHMTAIWESFNDQEIACNAPTVQDSGCAGTPTVAPTVTTGNGNQLVTLSWNAVPLASEYEVFRTEGVFACDFGKVKLGATAGTSWNDSGLQNGRDYSYVVIPKGPADSCFGPASACATAAPVGQPDFSVSCAPSSLAIAQGGSDTATCTVFSSFGYTGNVGLSCSGNPPGVACAFAPATVSPPADGSAAATLTLTVSGAQATGTFAFAVVGDDGASSRTSAMSVQVIPVGSNGPQNAVYDAALGAPRCSVAGSSCDTTTLVDSRDTLSPAEPNQPNTLDACADGISGTYHSDESNDRIVVSTLDGGNFTEGDTVEIAATVFAWSTGTSDTADFYFAADANNPTWNLITSIVPGSGAQTLTAQYVLPAGGQQAVRVQFRYQSTNAPCSTGTYNDRDDLVFAVEAPGGCTTDGECDDGAFCNGAETCNVGTGQCQAGTPPVCEDGLFCNGAETCNEATDSCDAGAPPACDDGLFCNGAESCNETTDSCDAGAPPVCGDGVFCNGAETCNETTDACEPGAAPSCDDGVGCTVDSCNAGTDACDHAPNAALCDNGLFCDGVETCDPLLDCQAGSDPCPGQSCDETGDICTAPNAAPAVTITAPADGASFTTADAITFAGSASDAEDGDLSANLSWSSSIDGLIGSGASFTTTLSEGSHTITASVTDSGGLPGSDAIGVAVSGICQPKNAPCDVDSDCCSNKCRGKTGSKVCK